MKVTFADDNKNFKHLKIRGNDDEFSPDAIPRPKDQYEMIWSDNKIIDKIEKTGSKNITKYPQVNSGIKGK